MVSSNSQMTGGCACGAIRYECSSDPLFVFICRCVSCRHATGSAFATNVWFPETSVTFTKGVPKEYIREASSGQPARHGFCENCGSPIGVRADAFAGIRGFSVGSFDEPSAFKPSANVWLKHRLPWDGPNRDIPGYDENIDADGIAKLTSP